VELALIDHLLVNTLEISDADQPRSPLLATPALDAKQLAGYRRANSWVSGLDIGQPGSLSNIANRKGLRLAT
jgi:hypothetical protein